MIHIPNLSKTSSSSSSSSSSFEFVSTDRVNDFEYYGEMDFPVDEDDVVMDSLDSRHKAIAIASCYDAFAAPTPLSMAVGSSAVVGAPGLDKPYEPKHLTESLKSKRSVYDFAINIQDSEVKKLHAPLKPRVLLPCAFTSELPLDELVQLFKTLFDRELSDVSYEFWPHDCCFSGVLARGSRYSDFKLRIYQNTGATGYIIEIQRLQKESCGFAFKSIVDAVKRALVGGTTSSSVDSADFSSGDFEFPSIDLGDSEQPSDEEIDVSLKQVLALAAEPNDQALLEACRMLCDFADQPELRQRMADAGCVRVLVDATQCDRLIIRQHAVLALAQLSECSECINAVIDCEGIPVLMSLACDGPYYTATMRKESARALANIASRKASEVAQQIGAERLASWAVQIADLSDATVKERAERANSYLQTVAIC